MRAAVDVDGRPQSVPVEVNAASSGFFLRRRFEEGTVLAFRDLTEDARSSRCARGLLQIYEPVRHSPRPGAAIAPSATRSHGSLRDRLLAVVWTSRAARADRQRCVARKSPRLGQLI
jgi:hypothetical protein